MWHMQLGNEDVPSVVKDRMKRVVQVSDAPWAPIQHSGWLTHVTSEEEKASFGSARDVFFKAILRELNLTQEEWQGHVADMTRDCNILPIDLAALDEDLVNFNSNLETLSEAELWAPLSGPIVGKGTFLPVL